MENNVYPVTIFTTRYQSVYEGGPWAALDCSFEEVPPAANGSDIEYAEFWAPGATRVLNVASGRTPEEALERLGAKPRSKRAQAARNET